MGFYRVTATGGRTFIRQSTSLEKATARALQEHPEGVQAVNLLALHELADLMNKGFSLPVRAREAARKYLKGLRQLRAAVAKSEDYSTRKPDPEAVRKQAEKDAARAAREKAKRQAKARASREATKAAKARLAEGQQGQRPGTVKVTTEMLLKGIEL